MFAYVVTLFEPVFLNNLIRPLRITKAAAAQRGHNPISKILLDLTITAFVSVQGYVTQTSELMFIS